MSNPVESELLQIISRINGGHSNDRYQSQSFVRYTSVQVGPRKKGQGVFEGEQGIISARILDKWCKNVELEITLLAAGFIVGNGGQSMKQIWKKTGASIRSFADKARVGSGKRTIRKFKIYGKQSEILETVKIIVEAVDRYKELIEGQHVDKVVDVKQVVRGVAFSYRPPPIEAIPTSARTIHFPGKPSEFGYQKRIKKAQYHSPSASSTSLDLESSESQASTNSLQEPIYLQPMQSITPPPPPPPLPPSSYTPLTSHMYPYVPPSGYFPPVPLPPPTYVYYNTEAEYCLPPVQVVYVPYGTYPPSPPVCGAYPYDDYHHVYNVNCEMHGQSVTSDSC